jgi:hypothetical protein
MIRYQHYNKSKGAAPNLKVLQITLVEVLHYKLEGHTYACTHAQEVLERTNRLSSFHNMDTYKTMQHTILLLFHVHLLKQ